MGIESALQDIGDRLSNATTVRAGFASGATYPDGGINVATNAAIQNFGAPAMGIPPRPFFSNAVAKGRTKWPKQLAKLMAGGMDARTALETMGMAMAGDIAAELIATNAPALKPATIKRKGSSKPLVDTGTMLQALQGPQAYEVS